LAASWGSGWNADAGDFPARAVHVQNDGLYRRIVERRIEVAGERRDRRSAGDLRKQVGIPEDRADDWNDRHATFANVHRVGLVNAARAFGRDGFEVGHVLARRDLENQL
jgi:hypothetical protein